jgi:heat shock protein HslJ
MTMNAEDLDVRMQAAGEQWRTANAVPADVDFAQPTSAADDVPVTRTAPPRSSRRRMRVVLAAGVGVAAAAAAAILVVSLGGFSPAHRREAAGTARPLVGTEWQLTTFVSADGTRSTPVRPASLTFDDRNFSGSDGCNDFGGSVTIDTGTLWVGALGSTLIGCPEPILTETRAIAGVLTATVHWSIDGDELTLRKEGVGSLVYRAAALAGVDWRLVAIRSRAVASEAPIRDADFKLTNGILTTSDECNPLTGRVIVRSATLELGSLTRKPGCIDPGFDPPFAAQNRQIRAILTGTVQWSITRGRLTITKPGIGTLTYEPARASDSVRPSPATSSR